MLLKAVVRDAHPQRDSRSLPHSFPVLLAQIEVPPVSRVVPFEASQRFIEADRVRERIRELAGRAPNRLWHIRLVDLCSQSVGLKTSKVMGGVLNQLADRRRQPRIDTRDVLMEVDILLDIERVVDGSDDGVEERCWMSQRMTQEAFEVSV